MPSEDLTPGSIVVAYHSGYGHTAVLAKAVAEGASERGGEVTLLDVTTIDDAAWAALDAADAIIFGAPTYMGGASAEFHRFAELTGGRFFRSAWADKLAAGFTNSGSKAGDKSNTLGFLQALAAQHHMIWINLGMAAGWNFKDAGEDDLNRLGFWSGAAGQTHNDVAPDAMHGSDIATAAHLGRQVARQTEIFIAGRHTLASATNNEMETVSA
ncbi:flavodoxin family protein [Curtobacterium sp. MCBA15_008]|uniref:flavodoxin family protein n=1 Tax=Curtobacterium sp. MCBA15_008 TaxID=1898736 RepID=UPI0008DD719C|nr:flavodoxin family protein [Curtobacterium sp. MCBA15_008]OII06925.1 NADPH-dependent FMN reductase [Curtobacterium sp. MCBA15_008]